MIKTDPAPETLAITPYSSFGYRDGANWRLRINGVTWNSPVSIGFRQRMMVRLLLNAMGSSPDETDCPMFHERVRAFLAESHQRSNIVIRIGNRAYDLPKKSRHSGFFQAWLSVPDAELKPHLEPNELGQPIVPIEAFVRDADCEPVSGSIHLIPPTGISIVTDIDDTIKESFVADRKVLLHNTFMREFQSVNGMAELYRGWAEAGASFHYVSSSPWQLYRTLDKWLIADGFPGGTVHLRKFRFRDQVLKKVMIFRRKGKAKAIKSLMKRLPERKFVLVGDSGEKDPEIYHKICKKFSHRVQGMFIRDLIEEPLTDDRCRKVFGGSAPRSGKFSTPNELAELMAPILGEKTPAAV